MKLVRITKEEAVRMLEELAGTSIQKSARLWIAQGGACWTVKFFWSC